MRQSTASVKMATDKLEKQQEHAQKAALALKHKESVHLAVKLEKAEASEKVAAQRSLEAKAKEKEAKHRVAHKATKVAQAQVSLCQSQTIAFSIDVWDLNDFVTMCLECCCCAQFVDITQ